MATAVPMIADADAHSTRTDLNIHSLSLGGVRYIDDHGQAKAEREQYGFGSELHILWFLF